MTVTFEIREDVTEYLASSGAVSIDDGTTITTHALSSGVCTHTITGDVRVTVDAVMPTYGASKCGFDYEIDSGMEEVNVWLGPVGPDDEVILD